MGQFVVRECLKRGWDTTNLDLKAPRDGIEPGSRFVFGDVSHRELLQPLMEGCDAVFHLGEIPTANVPLTREQIFSTNTRAGSTVMQTAADLRIRHLIYTSTCQVYGSWGEPNVPPLKLPVDETHPVQPTNVYSLSKVCNEQYAALTARGGKLNISIFRLPAVYTVSEISARWLSWLDSEDTEDRDGVLSYVHATDAAAALCQAAEVAPAGCETYNVSARDAQRGPVRQVLKAAFPHLPELPADWGTYQSPLIAEKARRTFNWEPKWSIIEQFERQTGRLPKLAKRPAST